MSKYLKKIPEGSFARGVVVLVGGAAFAQILNIAALPWLTRLYTPNDFDVLAVYAAILGVFSVVACLRLDIAIPICKEDSAAINLLRLSWIASLLMSLICALLVYVGLDLFFQYSSASRLRDYVWIIPFGVLLAGLYSSLSNWMTRRGAFGIIAKTKVTQSIGGVSIQILMGIFAKTGPLGLLLGHLLGVGGGVFRLAASVYADLNQLKLKDQAKESLVKTLSDNKRFPLYSSVEGLANVAAIQVPIIIIGFYAAGPEAGLLFLAMKVVGVPMLMIGGAMSQVYLSKAPDLWRSKGLAEFTLVIVKKLLANGVGPLLALGILAPYVATIVFGKEWARVGVLISWMIPWFVMQLLTSPVSMSLHVIGNQRLALCLQIFGFLIRVGGVLFLAGNHVEYIAEGYAVTGFLFYFLYFVVVLRVSGVRCRAILDTLRETFKIIFAWIVLAMVLSVPFLYLR